MSHQSAENLTVWEFPRDALHRMGAFGADNNLCLQKARERGATLLVRFEEAQSQLERLQRIERAARAFTDNFPSTYIDDGNCRKEWRELNEALSGDYERDSDRLECGCVGGHEPDCLERFK